jgi:hypothetical protein
MSSSGIGQEFRHRDEHVLWRNVATLVPRARRGTTVAHLLRNMAALRVLIGLACFLAFLAGRDTTTGSPADELAHEIHQPISQPRVDIYGNRIDQAVGDYRVDPRGDLYERHAPDSALLKLGPPEV